MAFDRRIFQSVRASSLPSSKLIRTAAVECLEDRRLMADIGAGLIANYYSDVNFHNLAAARTDATVDFNWGTGSPAVGVPAERFSARWTGQISAPKSGAYTLSADSAGGIKVVIDGKTVIDDSAFHTRRTTTGSFTFTQGSFYDVSIEYRDKGSATARLLWAPAGSAAQVVPQEDLFRLGTGWVSNGWLNTTVGGLRQTSGSLTSTGETYALTSAGFGSPGTRAVTGATGDLSQLAYKTLRGDGEMVAKLDNVSAGGKADLVFRKSLAADSAYFDLAVSGTTASVKYRSRDGAAVISGSSLSVSGPTYLKIKRKDTSFAAYVSPTGTDGTWTLVGTGGAFFDTFALSGFGLSAAGVQTRAAFSNVRVASMPSLGGNLQAIYDSSTEHPFVDILKLNGGFFLPTGGAAPVDSTGWPTVPSFQVFMNAQGLPAGKYTVTFNGPAIATVITKRTGTVVSRTSYDPITGAQVWTATVSPGVATIGLQFNGMIGWGKNIRVLQPGYSTVNTPIYTDRYLNFLRALNPASLRFMDWTLTNNVTISDWSQRATATTANWAKAGVAWEAAINLCNTLGSDLYVNIPGRATDDYVQQLALLIRTTLRPDLNVYLEQGNEMWATNFANGKWNYQSALTEVQAGRRAGVDSNLNYDHTSVNLTQTDLYAGGNGVWALRRTARRAKQIGDIFKATWLAGGLPDPTNTRVRVVIAAQVANLYSYDVMFKFLNDVYGKPGNYIYAMAAAPYFTMGIYNDHFSNGKWTTLTQSATSEQLIGAMQASSGAYAKVGKYSSFWSHGKSYGVKLMMYEGGHDTFGPFNIAAKKAATLDPRMKTMMKGYLGEFFAEGGVDFNYYTLGAKTYDSQYGTWSITNDFNNLNTPKAQAFKEIRQGIGLPAAVPSAGVSA